MSIQKNNKGSAVLIIVMIMFAFMLISGAALKKSISLYQFTKTYKVLQQQKSLMRGLINTGVNWAQKHFDIMVKNKQSQHFALDLFPYKGKIELQENQEKILICLYLNHDDQMLQHCSLYISRVNDHQLMVRSFQS